MNSVYPPHLLHVFINDEGYMEYSVECPETGADRPCALLVECTEHQKPDEPESEFPGYRWNDDGSLQRDEKDQPLYVADADPKAIAEWEAFSIAEEAWDAEHEPGTSTMYGYHRKDDCWVQTWVANDSIGNGWDLVGFKHVEVNSPFSVEWTNRGDLDDSYLELSPWKENSEEATDDRSGS